MTNATAMTDTRDIVIDEVLPHGPEVVWKTLTNAELIGRWLMMPSGFEPTKGKHFTFQTTPAGEWDGVIHCEVLEVTPNERLVYAWTGGDDSNARYGSRLETIVTWTLAAVDGGTRLRLVHSGFRMPKNAFALKGMSEGWPQVFQRIEAIAGEPESTEGARVSTGRRHHG
jgi:uncharacterized protein YndB with AHSA1/START domain